MIDLQKTFNSVRIENTLHLLYNRRIPLVIIKTIQNVYEDNVAMVKLEGKLKGYVMKEKEIQI